MIRAFVAGATGYTGRAVVAGLRKRGVTVSAHVRPDSPRLEEWRTRFEGLGARVNSTPWHGDALLETFRSEPPDVVYALLGTTRKRARSAAESGEDSSYQAVDRDLTLLLLSATVAAAPHARFVYLSSLGADAAAGNAYMRVRGEVEAALRASGVDHVIARPSFVTGPDRQEARPAERGAAIAVDALLAVAARLGGRRLRDRYASMTGQELAEALVTLGFDRTRAGGVFETAALRAARSA
jgi:uncharacterized protein YbjT (DUF2867 family)